MFANKRVFRFFVFCLCSISIFFVDPIKGNGAEKSLIDRIISDDMRIIPQEMLGRPILLKENLKSSNLKNGVLSAPFATDQSSTRFSIDEKVDLDLSGSSIFYLDLSIEDPDALGSCYLYFHSENGWLTIPGFKQKMLNQHSFRFTFSVGEARKEEDPTGFHKIDTIRISFWRNKDIDTSIEIQGLYGGRGSSCILDVNVKNKKESELFVSGMEKFYKTCGFSYEKIPLTNLSIDLLKKYKCVIIPIQGDLDDQSVDILCDYLDQGGFILGFYLLPPKLMKKMGFSPALYYPNSQKKEPVAKIVFTEDFKRAYAPYMPDEMDQNSHNIGISQPLEKDLDPFLQKEENRPRVAGWWYNPQGKKMKYPAILFSGRGIFYSHVLIQDDFSRKQAFFFALLQNMDPLIHAQVFYNNWYQLLNYGIVPKENLHSFYRERGSEILRQFKNHGWSEEKISDTIDIIKSIQFEKSISREEKNKINELNNTIRKIHQELSLDFARKTVRQPDEKWFCWEHSGTGPYPGDWERTIREIASAGFNGIVSNMIRGGSASYNSKILPRDEKYEKYGDQIEQIIRVAKKYGVEVHIWKVCFNCSRASQSFLDQMRKEGRFQKSDTGSSYTNEWLCPSHPKNQDLEVGVMLEVAENYKVDGIHFDYIRYPGPKFCFCDGCRDRFSAHYKKETGQDLTNWPTAVSQNPQIRAIFDQWRCDQITSVVRRVREEVDRKHLPVKISAAVFRDYPNTKINVAQDWIDWCKKGYLDFVCPMNYTSDPDFYEQNLLRQGSFLKGSVLLYSGIGATCPSQLTPDKFAALIQITRQCGIPGICMFDLSQTTIKSLIPAFKKPDQNQ